MRDTSETVCDIGAPGFLCERLPEGHGYTWTLTTRLSEFLAEAERRFGPRDQTYTPLGIEFSGDRPQTWFPGNRRHIAIQLTRSAWGDPPQALFQLSHETIHLLSPIGGRSAPVLEEGLATIFQHEKSTELRLGLRMPAGKYLEAEALVKDLFLQLGADAVLKLRGTEPCFLAMTPGLIESFGVPEKLARALCEPFYV